MNVEEEKNLKKHFAEKSHSVFEGLKGALQTNQNFLN